MLCFVLSLCTFVSFVVALSSILVRAMLDKNQKSCGGAPAPSPAPPGGGGGRPLDPKYAKYARRKKKVYLEGSVRNKMQMEAMSPTDIAIFFGDPIPGGDGDGGGGKRDLSKYERMKKVGSPAGSIRNKMKQDKIHIYWICTFFGDPLPQKKEVKKVVVKVKLFVVKYVFYGS